MKSYARVGEPRLAPKVSAMDANENLAHFARQRAQMFNS